MQNVRVRLIADGMDHDIDQFEATAFQDIIAAGKAVLVKKTPGDADDLVFVYDDYHPGETEADLVYIYKAAVPIDIGSIK